MLVLDLLLPQSKVLRAEQRMPLRGGRKGMGAAPC